MSIYDQVENQEDISSYQDHLVGEGKKFKDTEALARGKFEADRHIATLERELQELRTSSNERANLQQLIEQLRTAGASTHAPQGVVERPQGEVPVSPASMSKEDIAAIVNSVVSENKSRDQRSKNMESCAEELRKTFGENYVSKLRETTKALGLSEAYIDELAGMAPKAVIALMGQPQGKVNAAPPRSSILSGPSAHKTGARDWQWYENIRKSDPNLYKSAAFQKELHDRVLSGEVQLP